MRRRGIRVAAQLGSRPPTDARATELDFVATSFPHFVPRLREAGLDAEYLPLAFDPRVLERLRTEGADPDACTERPHAVVFVGGIHRPSVHRGGTALLERLSRELGMEVWGYVDDRLSRESPLLRNHHGEAWGLDMYRVLARTRVAINRHGDIAEGHANNMRLFEATGAGALLATEAADNLPELFEPGREVLAYDDADDLSSRSATTSPMTTSGARWPPRVSGARCAITATPSACRRLPGCWSAGSDASPRGRHLLRRVPRRALPCAARAGGAPVRRAARLAHGTLLRDLGRVLARAARCGTRRRRGGGELPAAPGALGGRARRGTLGARRGAPSRAGRRARPQRAAAPDRPRAGGGLRGRRRALPGHVLLRAFGPRRAACGRAPRRRPDRIPAARRRARARLRPRPHVVSALRRALPRPWACRASTCRLAFHPGGPRSARRGSGAARARSRSSAASTRACTPRGRRCWSAWRARCRWRCSATAPSSSRRRRRSPPRTAARRGAWTCTGCSRSRASPSTATSPPPRATPTTCASTRPPASARSS